MQVQERPFTAEMLAAYLETNRENAARLHLDSDVVIIHDPQPAAVIVFTRRPASAGTGREGGRWIWRCHIDASRPQRRAWAFLRQFVTRYDGAIFSLPEFAQQLPIRSTSSIPASIPCLRKTGISPR